MDTLSGLRQRVVDVQRALGLPEPPPPAADVSVSRGRNYTEAEYNAAWAALDARDGLLCAGFALVCSAAVTAGSSTQTDARGRGLAVVEKAPPARRLAGAVLGTAGAGLFVLGAVGSRFDTGRPR
jgi:hypothetical protein